MTKEEFICKAVGLPWIDRACDWSAMDCWGVVNMYFEHVLKTPIPLIAGYLTGTATFRSEYINQLKYWEKTAAMDNAVFLSYKFGKPVHVGIVLDSQTILHSMGGTAGQVRIDAINVLDRIFEKTEYYIYVNLLSRPSRNITAF